MLIPPAHVNKIDITLEILEAAKRVNIGNVCLLSAAGCDLADRDAQPRLREFIELEVALMKMKGNPSTRTGYSNCIIRFVLSGITAHLIKVCLRGQAGFLCGESSALYS